MYKSISIARNGRPGPVWLDIALDIQWSDIGFKKKKIEKKRSLVKKKNIQSYKKVINLLKKSEKPLFVIGGGIKGKENEKLFKNFIKKFDFPFVSTWNAADVLHTSYNKNLGIIGMSGQRGANKAIFESDLIISLGARLAIPHTTTLFKNYAPKSKKIIFDIDINELKNSNVKFDHKINDDLSNFLKYVLKKNPTFSFNWENLKNFKEMNWYKQKTQKKPNSNFFWT